MLPPWRKHSHVQGGCVNLQKHGSGEAPSLSRPPGQRLLSPPFRHVRQMLSHEPTARGSAGEEAQALERAAEAGGPEMDAPLSPRPAEVLPEPARDASSPNSGNRRAQHEPCLAASCSRGSALARGNCGCVAGGRYVVGLAACLGGEPQAGDSGRVEWRQSGRGDLGPWGRGDRDARERGEASARAERDPSGRAQTATPGPAPSSVPAP